MAEVSDVTDTSGRTPLQETAVAGGESGTDSLDAKFTSFRLGGTSTAQDDKYIYSMNHKDRGLFIIINNRRFQPCTGMGERSGTDTDAANLYQRFKELGFQVQSYNNLTRVQMLKVMSEAAKQDHSQADCFGCALLSHGDEGVIYGVDGQIELDRLIDPFKGPQCHTLLGKPKIFIVQACRGTQLDHGVELVQGDADTAPEDDKVYRIPSESDFIYAYSTVAGFFSWRNSTRGSWFIQAMCKMLKENGRNMDFVRILTRVNHEVAYEYESNASKEVMNKKKQTPSIVSMLTKDLIFSKK